MKLKTLFTLTGLACVAACGDFGAFESSTSNQAALQTAAGAQECKLLEGKLEAARLEYASDPALAELIEQMNASEPKQRYDAINAEMDRLGCDHHDKCPQGDHTHTKTPQCQKLVRQMVDAVTDLKMLPAARKAAAHPLAKAYEAAAKEYSDCLERSNA